MTRLTSLLLATCLVAAPAAFAQATQNSGTAAGADNATSGATTGSDNSAGPAAINGNPAVNTGGTTTSGGTNAGATTAKGGDQVNGDTRQFITFAAQGGMAEVQLGQLAQQKAENPQVKQFGQRMVTDHTQLNNQLMQVAQQIGVQPPTQLNEDHRDTLQKLEKRSGAAFDRAYIDNMVDDHQRDLRRFKNQAQDGDNPQVKNLAQQAVPILQQHLQMAQQIQASLKNGGTLSGSGQ